jgi:hypothetical protein
VSDGKKVIDLNEVQRLFTKAWVGVLRDKPEFLPTFDQSFPGFYSRKEDIGIAVSGELYVIGHMDLKGNFVPNAGPFTSAAGAAIAAVGMVANSQASRALQHGD